MILDADVLIDLLRHNPRATAWLSSLPVLPAISGVAALEVLFGARDVEELRRVQRFLLRFSITWPIQIDAQSASSFASLRLSHGIGILDAMTATMSLRLGQEVATYNVKHFHAVPGVKTIQPY